MLLVGKGENMLPCDVVVNEKRGPWSFCLGSNGGSISRELRDSGGSTELWLPVSSSENEDHDNPPLRIVMRSRWFNPCEGL